MSTEKSINIDFLPIISRIKEHKKVKHDCNVAKLLGYSDEAFSERKRRNSAPLDKLELFCERESINIDWLLYGKVPKFKKKHGEMIAREPIIPYGGPERRKNRPYSDEEQGYIDMLIDVLRGGNKDHKRAIIENIKAFYNARVIVDSPGELKKANNSK